MLLAEDTLLVLDDAVLDDALTLFLEEDSPESFLPSTFLFDLSWNKCHDSHGVEIIKGAT